MKLKVFLLVCCFPLLIYGQDSLSKTKLKINDLSFLAIVHPVFDGYSSNEVNRFAKNQALLDESKGYTPSTYGYNEGSDKFDFGLGLSLVFKNTKNPFLKRLKPRISLLYGMSTYQSDRLSFQESFTIDTLYFTNPNVSPLYIDSVVNGSLNYKYYSSQLLVELGANIDVFTKPYFNFYAGFVFSKGLSLSHEFTAQKYEYAYIDPYPDEKYSSSQTLKNYTLKESGQKSSLTRFAACFGYQHRFSKHWKTAPGFFIELRPGFETCRLEDGTSLSRFIFSTGLGFRLSLSPHK